MWSWIYRAIAALLALVGGAVLTLVGRALDSGARQLSLVVGEAALVLIAALASSMLVAAIMILWSPASRPGAR